MSLIPSISQLAAEIEQKEHELISLREQFIERTGYLPSRRFEHKHWRWTIFMALGFAYISCMVYLLGIRKSGFDEGFYIPEFFFQTDFAYFGILTFYFLFALLMGQMDRISGFQCLSLLLGFWCAHWLVYDWAWWAIEIGFGHQDMSKFWNTGFGVNLMIINPPMWVFLLEAILGGFMALYTFTIPKRTLHLLPSIMWLYTVYAHPTVALLMNLPVNVVNGLGIAGAAISFGMMVGMSIPFVGNQIRYLKEKKGVSEADPLGVPWIFLILLGFLFMYIFLVLVPVIGLMIGMIMWYFLPFLILLVRSFRVMRWPKSKRVKIEAILIGGIVLLMLIVSILV
jgi:hypothetical protein